MKSLTTKICSRSVLPIASLITALLSGPLFHGLALAQTTQRPLNYYVEDLDLVVENLMVVGTSTHSPRFVGKTQIRQYVHVLEMNLDGEIVFALSRTFSPHYESLPFRGAFVELRPLNPYSLHEALLLERVPEILALDSDRQFFILNEIIPTDRLISVTGSVESCSRTSTSRIYSISTESLCIGEYLVPELADYLGEELTVLLKPSNRNSETQCHWLQKLTDSRGCRLKSTDFIAEVRQEGLVLVQNYVNEFKDPQGETIFEYFPVRADADGVTSKEF